MTGIGGRKRQRENNLPCFTASRITVDGEDKTVILTFNHNHQIVITFDTIKNAQLFKQYIFIWNNRNAIDSVHLIYDPKKEDVIRIQTRINITLLNEEYDDVDFDGDVLARYKELVEWSDCSLLLDTEFKLKQDRNKIFRLYVRDERFEYILGQKVEIITGK